MKKLVVGAAVALAAVCSQAASVDWTVTGTAADVGLKVYVVSALSEFTSESDVAAAALGTAGNSGTFTGTRAVAAGGSVGGLDDNKSGQTQDFYYVIVSSDGKGFCASGKQSAEVYTTSNTHQDSEVAASTFKTGDYTAWSTGGGGGGGSGGVPEPTSGLLLLVGGAMLALRRKQK